MPTDANNPSTQIDEDDFQELLTLVRTLRLASGVTILFAQCNSAEYRNKLIKQARQLYGGGIAEVRIPQGSDHLLDYLVETVPEYAAAIFILGIEDWLPSGTAGETSRFVATLNSTRDHFPQCIHCPIVFWGPSHILTTLFRGAPDFFSTISGIYTFAAGEEKQIPQTHVAIPDREAERRETELMALLAEHDSLPEDRQDETTRAVLLLGIGKARREAGRYDDAEQSLKEALEITERRFGVEHPETASPANELGSLYLLENRYADAERLFEQSLQTREDTLGPNHPSTATNLNNLGSVYQAQNKYDDAEAMYQRALKIYEQTLVASHPFIATSLNNMAGLYYAQGRYADAEPMLVRALEISELSLGVDNPDTATSLDNLGVLYDAQGKSLEAELLYRRALEIRKRALGDNHPFTRESIHNLNELYRLQHRYEEMLP